MNPLEMLKPAEEPKTAAEEQSVVEAKLKEFGGLLDNLCILNEELEQQNNQYACEMERLGHELDTAQRRYEEAVNTAGVARAEFLRQVTVIEQDVEQQNKDASELLGKYHSLEEQLAAEQAGRGQLERRLEQAMRGFNAMLEEKRVIEVNRNQLAVGLTSLTADFTEHKKTAELTLAAEGEKLKQAERKAQQYQNELAEANTALARKDGELASTKSILQQAGAKKAELEAKVLESKEQHETEIIEAISAREAEAARQRAELETDYAGRLAQITKTVQGLKEASNGGSELETKLAAALTQLDHGRVKFQELLGRQKQERESWEAEEGGYKQRIEAQGRRIRAQDAEIGALKASLTALSRCLPAGANGKPRVRQVAPAPELEVMVAPEAEAGQEAGITGLPFTKKVVDYFSSGSSKFEVVWRNKKTREDSVIVDSRTLVEVYILQSELEWIFGTCREKQNKELLWLNVGYCFNSGGKQCYVITGRTVAAEVSDNSPDARAAAMRTIMREVEDQRISQQSGLAALAAWVSSPDADAETIAEQQKERGLAVVAWGRSVPNRSCRLDSNEIEVMQRKSYSFAMRVAPPPHKQFNLFRLADTAEKYAPARFAIIDAAPADITSLYLESLAASKPA